MPPTENMFGTLVGILIVQSCLSQESSRQNAQVTSLSHLRHDLHNMVQSQMEGLWREIRTQGSTLRELTHKVNGLQNELHRVEGEMRNLRKRRRQPDAACCSEAYPLYEDLKQSIRESEYTHADKDDEMSRKLRQLEHILKSLTNRIRISENSMKNGKQYFETRESNSEQLDRFLEKETDYSWKSGDKVTSDQSQDTSNHDYERQPMRNLREEDGELYNQYLLMQRAQTPNMGSSQYGQVSSHNQPGELKKWWDIQSRQIDPASIRQHTEGRRQPELLDGEEEEEAAVHTDKLYDRKFSFGFDTLLTDDEQENEDSESPPVPKKHNSDTKNSDLPTMKEIILNLDETETGDDRERTSDGPKKCSQYVSNVERTRQIKSTNSTVIGILLKDTFEDSLTPESVWVLARGNAMRWNRLVEYQSMEDFQHERNPSLHRLEEACTGLGAVLFNRHLFCQSASTRLRGSRNIMLIKISLDSNKVVSRRRFESTEIASPGVPNADWAGIYSRLQFTSDGRGLWLLSSAQRSRHLMLMTINPISLAIETRVDTHLPKNKLGPAFIVCGVLYTLNGHDTTHLKYVYDIESGERRELPQERLPLPLADIASAYFSPLEQKLYVWRILRGDSGKIENARSATNHDLTGSVEVISFHFSRSSDIIDLPNL